MSAVIETQDHTPMGVTPVNLLQIAVERGADVDSLTKLMDLQERQSRECARRAFFAARAKFQAKCPTITKDREVKYGNTAYKYATLSGIAEQVRGPMEDCGLTFRFEFDESEGSIKVTCIVSHVDGHSESNSMTALPDDSGAKNLIQQRGSTVSYLQRYTLIGALGLTSAIEDDDGASSGATNVEFLRRHNDALREHLDTVAAVKTAIAINDLETAVEAWNELDEESMRALWVAPTKGGIFTTSERATMKSNEWAAARNAMGGKAA